MKLNNPSSIYLNNFTVEIVNGSEKYATELGSRTSASFHIRESK